MLITLKEAATRLQAANRILITAHVQPDGDAIGSTLATMQILRAMGKTAEIFIDDSVRRNLQALPHFEQIRRPADGEHFDADLLLVLDTSPDRIGNVRKLTDAPLLNVDHHVTNIGDGYALYVETKAAATCEIIFKLARELGEAITPAIATCLYTGIATDTGFFQFSNTRADTLAIASELITCGVSPHFISEQMEKKTLAEVIGLRDALNTLKIYYGNKVAGMTLDYATVSKFDSTEGIIDEIRVIDTVDVAFLISERAPNVCRVSMRSKDVDVAKIAARLGGGGHIRAAGCTLKTTLKDAEKILVEAIGKAL
ncbi:MAG: bifunctional oligoribonuclease/PAP phosphatase NrnA [Selenomonadaceae bacterium]|nr:bifunctional oligoribonuclease/PAP phosphatase NrnA [Selenomonadaceae bacterium]